MWTCSKCGKSYAKTNQYHVCATSDLETLFKGNKNLQSLYHFLLDEIKKSLGEFVIKHSKKAITWSNKVAFVLIYPRRDSIELQIFSTQDYEGVFPIFKTQQYTQKKFLNYVRIYEQEDIDRTVLSLLEEAYQIAV